MSNTPTSSLAAADTNASLSSAVTMTSLTDDVSRSAGALEDRDVIAAVMLQIPTLDELPVIETN